MPRRPMAHRPRDERPGLTSAGSTVERYRRICRGLRSSSTSATGPVRAARASCTGSARTGVSGWTSSRRSSGLVTRRPKYACRTCEDGVVQAPAPARLIEGGLPTEATVAQILVSKYADHLPLYRQAQIYARQGIDLDRSMLADWVGHAAWQLRPLHERLLMRIRALPRLFADETTAPVLDPGRGRTKTGQLCAYAADDRPWGGSDPPGVAYVYAARVRRSVRSAGDQAGEVAAARALANQLQPFDFGAADGHFALRQCNLLALRKDLYEPIRLPYRGCSVLRHPYAIRVNQNEPGSPPFTDSTGQALAKRSA
jgi:transposase